jgi:hypothetical protein
MLASTVSGTPDASSLEMTLISDSRSDEAQAWSVVVEGKLPGKASQVSDRDGQFVTPRRVI